MWQVDFSQIQSAPPKHIHIPQWELPTTGNHYPKSSQQVTAAERVSSPHNAMLCIQGADVAIDKKGKMLKIAYRFCSLSSLR